MARSSHLKHLFAVSLLLLSLAAPLFAANSTLSLSARTREKDASQPGGYAVQEKTLQWDAGKTAIVICDMWDKHWCAGATRRVAEMAPRMNEVVSAARDAGVLIIHCPSSCLDHYKDSPMRKLAQQAPVVETKIPLERWCYLDKETEGALPIDDSDGGCDCTPQCKNYQAWSSQIDAIDIQEGDAVTDSAEAFYLMKQRGVENVIVMGVHTNMCVLGRPFSIRQMVGQGQNVVLMRDMTDSMYNPRKRPFVPHARGTELVIEHIEKHWCPTITSSEFTGQPAFRFTEDKRPHVVFLVNENHYHSAQTLPNFAAELQDKYGYYVTFIAAEPGNGFAGTEVLDAADLLVVYARREALSKQQKQDIENYLAAGKPLIGLRTASHAFGARGDLPEGMVAWNEFDAQILGGNYQGHYNDGSEISVANGAAKHPILVGVDAGKWTSASSLYKTSPIDKQATLLLTGVKDDHPAEPVAWTRMHGKSRIFYTSLGHPDDFKQLQFRAFLTGAVQWALGEKSGKPLATEN